MPETRTGPGRPRDPGTEERILQTALRQLAAAGYSAMSIDQIALEAGVSKPTIYRRWEGKAELAAAAVACIAPFDAPPHRETRVASVEAILETLRRDLTGVAGFALTGTAVAEQEAAPSLLAGLKERLLDPARHLLIGHISAARDARELRKSIDPATAADMLIGTLYGHFIAMGTVPAEVCSQATAMLWEGLARKSALR